MIVPKGLTVVCLDIAEGEDQPASAIWRLDPKEKDLADARPLRVFVESTPRDQRRHWVIGDKWAFVANNADYAPPSRSDAPLFPRRVGGNWEYDWDDYSAALLVILPPRVGAVHADPPPRANVKAGDGEEERLLLWFARPARFGDLDNWIARWQVYQLEQWTTLDSVAAALNDANRNYREREPSTPAPVERADSGGQANGSPGYWWAAMVVTCLGLLTAAAGVLDSTLRTILEIVAAVLVAAAIAGFFYSNRRRRRSAT